MAPLTLHLIDPELIDSSWARQQLDDAERARADAFVFPRDAERWTRVRAAVRDRLARHLQISNADLQWNFGVHEKPSLVANDLAFNLSHGGSLSALLVATEGPVGVDLEPVDRGKDLIEAYEAFCHPDEIPELPPGDKSQALISLWTAKEAFLKAVGTGLSLAPQKVRVLEDRAFGPMPEFERLRMIRPTHPCLSHHSLAIAAPAGLDEVHVIPPSP